MSKKILLDKINIPGIKTYEVYRQNGGYASVEKAMKAMTPDEVVEQEVKHQVFVVEVELVSCWNEMSFHDKNQENQGIYL
jgi:hypothetical protein